MESKKILQIANKVYPKIRLHYGLGKKNTHQLKCIKIY